MFWALAALAATLFYYFSIRPQLYWSRRHVKQGLPIPVFGDNFRSIMRQETMHEMVIRIYNKFKGERYAGIYQTTSPRLMLLDPELIKQITIKDFDHFENHHALVPDTVDPMWSKNLFSLKGDAWREMRATLSPAFTASKMRSMFPLMEKSAQHYVNFYLNQKKNFINLELKDSFTRFANDVIANCAFGVSVDSLKEPENEFYLNVKEATQVCGLWKSLQFLLNLLAPKMAKFFKMSVFPDQVTWFFKKLIQDTFKIREEKNIVRNDMINLLMEAKKGRLRHEESNEQDDDGFATAQESEVGKKKHTKILEMTETEMAAQVWVFVFAGFESISTAMCFISYELAKNPDIQERLYKEIVKTYKENSNKITYDGLNKMKYLDMVVSESFRMHQPIYAADRICTKAYTILPERPNEHPVHLSPGDAIWVPIAGLHHDESIYLNPTKFDPERFSDDNKAKINPYSYIPFGIGPRNCVGSRFGLMEIKIIIFYILLNFEITVTDKTPMSLRYTKDQFNPSIEADCWVGFKCKDKSL